MASEQVKKRLEKLKSAIRRHRYLYHVLDKQEISDSALDSLKHELYLLEQRYPELQTADSPTQRVGGEPLKQFQKVKHTVPMLSIEDIFNKEEFRNWETYLKKIIPGRSFCYFAEMKIDGFAVSLIYKKGIFILGSTRGNGYIGEDVTQNLKTIESIPLKLQFRGDASSKMDKEIKKLINEGEIEIRGEVYMDKKDFQSFNAQRQKTGKALYSNPRNLAAGSIRQLNPKIAAQRPLKFLAYSIVTYFGQEKHSQEHLFLPRLGFKADSGKVCANFSETVKFWEEAAKKRKKLPFQIDGVVVMVNSNALFQKLGFVGKSPRGVRALKFSPSQAVTIVKGIKIQIGRTGAATPVCFLKPVEIEGVVISRATLHNADEIKKLGIKIGDTVIVGRAGDVIPQVIKVLKELRTGAEQEFKMPKRCPICGASLVRKKEEIIWRCQNPKCPARRRKRLYHFSGKECFDIRGLGPKIINQLLDEGLISDMSDIFGLKEGDLASLERFGDKSSKNLIKAIEKSKKIPLSKFLYSLSIKEVGEKTAQLLARHFKALDKIEKASLEDFQRLEDIGAETASSIYSFFQKKKNQQLIKKLLELGVNIINPSAVSARGKLDKKIFVFTGNLKTFSRSQAKEKIYNLGGNISESVSKNTNFVVAGKNPGLKLDKAKKLGIRILSEKEFLEILE